MGNTIENLLWQTQINKSDATLLVRALTAPIVIKNTEASVVVRYKKMRSLKLIKVQDGKIKLRPRGKAFVEELLQLINTEKIY